MDLDYWQDVLSVRTVYFQYWQLNSSDKECLARFIVLWTQDFV